MKRLIVILIFLFPFSVFAQQEYGRANFSRNNTWSRDNLAEYFRLDPGTMGSSLGEQGDFETWTGAEGGCEDCPEGFGCACVGDSEVRSETTKIFKSNTSMGFSTNGANNVAVASGIQTFQANKCYQVSWAYAGDAGNEDYVFALVDAAIPTEYYNFTTDTWQAAPIAILYANISTSWTRTNLFIRTGIVTKTDYIFLFSNSGASQVYYFDDLQLQELHSCDVIGEMTNVLSSPVGSDPFFGHAEALLPTRGTGPAGWWGLQLDGTDDCLIGGDILSPTEGELTIACWTIPDTITGTHTPISQWHSVAGQCSYLLNFDTDDVKWYVDDDGTGGTPTMIEDSDVLVANTEQRFVATYKQIGSGSSEMTLQVNHETEITSNTAVAPIWDSTGDFCIGAAHGGANIFSGFMCQCTVWHKLLDSVARNKIISPYFPGNNHGDGFYVSSCSQAASHSTCSSQKCRNGTPNACQASGQGVMEVFTDYDELVPDPSWEEPIGDDSDPSWADWPTITEVPGDGTANITAYRDDTRHGEVALRIKLTGTTSFAWTGTDCLPILPNTTYFGYVHARMLSGAPEFQARWLEYSDAGCVFNLVSNVITHNPEMSTSWKDYQNVAFTTAATTNFYKFSVMNYGSTSDILIDTVSLKAAEHYTPWIDNPTGAGTTAYNSRQYILHNPLTDWSDQDTEYMYTNGACFEMCLYTDWEGDDGVDHTFINIPGTAGNNNRFYIVKTAGDVLQFRVYDSAATTEDRTLAATSGNWPAGFKFLTACHDNNGTLAARHYDVSNETWYAWSTVVGVTTSQTAQSDEFHVGHTADTNYLDGYITRINVSEYSAIYPHLDFEACKAFSRSVY